MAMQPYISLVSTLNTALNDLQKIICLRKSDVSIERVSVCYVVQNFSFKTLSAMLLYQWRPKYVTTMTSH